MGKLIKWLDEAGVGKFFFAYLGVSAVVLVASVLVFFPLLLVYEMLGKEFSNLGPIVTLLYGILFEVFVVTPAFFVLFLVKVMRRARKG